MSSSAYAIVFRNLGGGFRTRNHGSNAGSGSGANREDAAKSVAPVNLDNVILDQENAILIDNAYRVGEDTG